MTTGTTRQDYAERVTTSTLYMEELIVLLAQFLFEVVLNVLGNVPFEWLSRSRKTPDPPAVWPTAMAWFLLGALIGWLSTLLISHTLITLPTLRVLNLLVSPIASALLSHASAQHRSKLNPNITPRNHFWYAFWFTFGLVLARLAYALRA